MTPRLLTGLDMVDVERLARMLKTSGEEFLLSAWTARELDYCRGRPDRLATRWAAKEATLKALGQGIGRISPLEVEIETGPRGAPALLLHENARKYSQALNVQSWSVSLSHESGLAIAFVVGISGVANV